MHYQRVCGVTQNRKFLNTVFDCAVVRILMLPAYVILTLY